MKVKVYIPTRGRIGLNRQPTLREFLKKSNLIPVLVCPPNEKKAHLKYAPKVVACPREGIGPTRQWILEKSKADVAIMADDDMRFSYRPEPHAKLEICNDLTPLIRYIKYCVRKGFIHGGVGARQGNNRKDLTCPRGGIIDKGMVIVDCERVNNMHFMNPKAVRKLARLDALSVMEDFHFTLTLLTKGYANRVIHNYVWNQEGSGAQGGCSIYRTPQVQADGAEGLYEAFPDYVSVVTKVSKDSSPAWRQFKERKDVIVQWLKAARKGGIDI